MPVYLWSDPLCRVYKAKNVSFFIHGASRTWWGLGSPRVEEVVGFFNLFLPSDKEKPCPYSEVL